MEKPFHGHWSFYPAFTVDDFPSTYALMEDANESADHQS